MEKNNKYNSHKSILKYVTARYDSQQNYFKLLTCIYSEPKSVIKCFFNFLYWRFVDQARVDLGSEPSFRGITG